MAKIPLPSGIDAAQRRFREIQAAVDNTGTRSLESASINQGNLRVRHGGNIIIGDGGALHITGGDLILGKGKIQGDALAEQFTAQTFSSPLSRVSDRVYTARRNIISQTVSPPSWAKKTLVIASWYSNAVLSYQVWSYETPDVFGNVLVAGQRSVEKGFDREFQRLLESDNMMVSGSGVGIFEIPGNTNFLLAVEQRASASGAATVNAQLDALCLFTRNNS